MEEVKEGMDQEELDAQLQTILLRAFAKGRCGIKRTFSNMGEITV